MLGYGSSKSAAHHYLQSYGPPVHEQNDVTAVGILPLMIDTPANRAMLGATEDSEDNNNNGYNKMVHPRHIANEIGVHVSTIWRYEDTLRPRREKLYELCISYAVDPDQMIEAYLEDMRQELTEEFYGA